MPASYPTELTREVLNALGAAFPDDEIEFLPRATSGGKALGLAYIDARSVMRRLDAVVGPGNWTFDFDVLSPDGKMVKGRLSVLGVTKCDAGESNAEDEPLKSAVSDALKRCAVHFGIGRYLYYLPRIWAPFDPQKRQFVEPPRFAPAAVERALAICGIPPSRTAEPGRKSVWAAGETGPGAPESRGDRAAVQPPAAAPPPPPTPGRGQQRAAAAVRRGETRKPTGEPAPAPAEPEALVCSRDGCGKGLTKGQHDVSVRGFGQPLCPACQKLTARSG